MKPLDCDLADLNGPEALAVATREPEPAPMEIVFDELCNAGLSDAAAFLTAQRIEPLVQRYALELAAEALRYLASGLDGTASAVALRRALIGSDHTLAADGAAVGCSPQRIFALEKKTRKRIAAITGEGS